MCITGNGSSLGLQYTYPMAYKRFYPCQVIFKYVTEGETIAFKAHQLPAELTFFFYNSYLHFTSFTPNMSKQVMCVEKNKLKPSLKT